MASVVFRAGSTQSGASNNNNVITKVVRIDRHRSGAVLAKKPVLKPVSIAEVAGLVVKHFSASVAASKQRRFLLKRPRLLFKIA